MFEYHHRLKICFFQKRPDLLWGPPSLIFSTHRGSFQCVRRLGLEVDLSSASSAEVNVRGYASSPPICVHGVRSVFSPYMRSWRALRLLPL